jgi:hypothetical protein
MDISATRQKPGTRITPYSSRNIPRGLLDARTIGSPILLPAFDKPDGIHWFGDLHHLELVNFPLRKCKSFITNIIKIIPI